MRRGAGRDNCGRGGPVLGRPRPTPRTRHLLEWPWAAGTWPMAHGHCQQKASRARPFRFSENPGRLVFPLSGIHQVTTNMFTSLLTCRGILVINLKKKKKREGRRLLCLEKKGTLLPFVRYSVVSKTKTCCTCLLGMKHFS